MVKKLKFLLNDTEIDAEQPAHTTLLDFLRSLGRTGTKEGCASGDCGACTVLVRDCDTGWQTINACIAPLGRVAGKQVITVEGLADAGNLHPVQQALVHHNASQCGFCTPGFVMSLVALVENDTPAERERVVGGIAGNLCRCTGYRPIVAAGLEVLSHPLDKLLLPDLPLSGELAGYFRPRDQASLHELMVEHVGARLISGGTDLMLEVTQQYRDLPCFIGLSEVIELQRWYVDDDQVEIGAAVTYSSIEQDLCDRLGEMGRQLRALLHRLGSRQVRNVGTVGGNLANGSPIADMPPVLMAMDAIIEITSIAGGRRISVIETFYEGYRQTTLQPDEYIAMIRLPVSAFHDFHRFYKSSKRIEDDISSVMGAFRFTGSNGEISGARIAYGGMAATPVRLHEIEQLVLGKVDGALITNAVSKIAEVMQPLSDVRASADYRRAVAESMLERALREFGGEELPMVMEAM
ncbi:MAG: FAD binding domain-containing protein [Pseudomonadales bacterium]|nr:FAD binding domain-containing protein [Pseudomonadales bacterium]